VDEVVSGFAGGDIENPSYEEVSNGRTGHVEAVQVWFDPEKITYKEIVDKFWRQINPTDAGGQFGDRGFQYTTAIFYHNDEQKNMLKHQKKK
jgi:peptide methionine sulfoxide reductase msrA/msrB